MSVVNQPAPLLDVAKWFQGDPSNIDQEAGKVILIEVFQVNCPGCFIGGLPEVIETCLKFKERPLVVWGLATAFEDYHLNNLENLHKLLDTGEVVGHTLQAMMERNLLSMGRLQYFLPFPVAMDRIVKREGEADQEELEKFIQRDFPDFQHLTEPTRAMIREQVQNYLAKKEYDAKTFDTYGLKGTPSSIIIDKKGILRYKLFGSGLGLESIIEPLLDE